MDSARGGPHDALNALVASDQEGELGARADIKASSHAATQLVGKFVEHRVADRRIVRLIQEWLRAGCWKRSADT
jgi:hypothetical protein